MMSDFQADLILFVVSRVYAGYNPGCASGGGRWGGQCQEGLFTESLHAAQSETAARS